MYISISLEAQEIDEKDTLQTIILSSLVFSKEWDEVCRRILLMQIICEIMRNYSPFFPHVFLVHFKQN